MALFLAMCSFSLAMSLSPGPVNLITASSGANYGFKKTIPFVSGATVGFTLLLIATGLGISELLHVSTLLWDGLVYTGCVFVAYMGYQLMASSNEISIQKVNTPNFLDGLLLQWLNPKAWVACVAGVSAFSSDGSLYSLLVFSIIYFFVCFLSIGAWAYAGFKASKLLASSTHLKAFNAIMGAGLIAIAIYLALMHFISN